MTCKVKCSLFLNILLFCLFVLTGCGEPKELTNSNGVIVKGGNFPEGSELVSREVSVISAEGFAAIEVIKKVDYDKYSSVYIYDIHVLNNKNKVQPDEEVTITLPFKDDSFKNCIIIVLKPDNSCEVVTPQVTEDALIFKTSVLSYFIIANK